MSETSGIPEQYAGTHPDDDSWKKLLPRTPNQFREAIEERGEMDPKTAARMLSEVYATMQGRIDQMKAGGGAIAESDDFGEAAQNQVDAYNVLVDELSTKYGLRVVEDSQGEQSDDMGSGRLQVAENQGYKVVSAEDPTQVLFDGDPVQLNTPRGDSETPTPLAPDHVQNPGQLSGLSGGGGLNVSSPKKVNAA